MPKYRTWTDEQLIDAVKNNQSMRQVLRQLQLKDGGASSSFIKKKMNELNLSTDHWTGQGWLKGGTHDFNKKSFEDLFCKTEFSNTSFTKLKERLISDGYWLPECQKCGTSTWMNVIIGLQVHHIDGDRCNNTLSNLQLLCPNCHSITDNYAGKSSRTKFNVIISPTYNCVDCNCKIATKRQKRCKLCFNSFRKTDDFSKKNKLKLSTLYNILDSELIANLEKFNFNLTSLEKIYKLSRTSIRKELVKRKINYK